AVLPPCYPGLNQAVADILPSRHPVCGTILRVSDCRREGGATMFDRVILTCTEGPLKGRKFVLENGAHCVVGRAKDCSIQVPDDLSLVSRHHCLIDVDAPDVRVRDLGSLNGTYVNGETIGRRYRGEPPEEGRWPEQPGHRLW